MADRARRVAQWVRFGLAALVSLAAVVGVLRLVVPATAGIDGEPPGVVRQLAFIRSALDHGAGEQAQGLFPEGYFFLSELYGLAWVELGLRKPAGDRDASVREARWALARLETPAGRDQFSPDLTPAYGVFYRGWTNWLRGGVLALQAAGRRDPAEVARFEADSAALATAFDGSESPYLAAYPGQAWPVDSTVAIASLRLHDSLLSARFGPTVQRWLAGVRARLDPHTGLMPHRVDLITGAPAEGARASSQSVIQRFLVDVDPGFARDQYLRFRDSFVVSPLGLGPAVREYPIGVDGMSDVDSGPLLLGVSLSATAITLGAAQSQRDAPLAAALASYGEFAGVPIDTPHTRRYALGVMPIGDAFLAWAKTARPWVSPPPAPPPATVSWAWRLPLLTLLAVIGLLPWLPAAIRRYRRRPPIRCPAGARRSSAPETPASGAGPARPPSPPPDPAAAPA